jgi:hypothetical protein
MRTSSDFFDKLPDNFESLDNSFAPRPTVPLVPEKLSIPPLSKLPPTPRVNYPVLAPPPPPQSTALEQVQQAIQKEVSDLQQKKPTLDQLIQNALKQKMQYDRQIAQQKVITFKKSAPLPVVKKVTQTLTPGALKVPTQPVTRIAHRTQPIVIIPKIPPTPKPRPFQQPTRSLWWPSEKEVIQEKLHHQKEVSPLSLTPPTAPLPKPQVATLAPNSGVKIAPPKIAPPLTRAPILKPPLAAAKVAFHVSNHLINYFLFAISQESDPYHDSNRQKLIYGLKVGGYLTTIAGIFILLTNFGLG